MSIQEIPHFTVPYWYGAVLGTLIVIRIMYQVVYSLTSLVNHFSHTISSNMSCHSSIGDDDFLGLAQGFSSYYSSFTSQSISLCVVLRKYKYGPENENWANVIN